MTLYFFDRTQEPTPFTPVYLDGNYSGYETYRVQLISKYNNLDIEQDGDIWFVEADFIMSNERYTELGVLFANGAFIETTFRSGYYTFKLWGSLQDIPSGEPFDESDWTLLHTQECKVKTDTTNDMQRGEQTETVKYTTTPNTAESYVIYNQ